MVIEQLQAARPNAQSIDTPSPVQNGSDNTELQQQLQQLTATNPRPAKPQLFGQKNDVREAVNQAAVNAFTGSLSSEAVVPRRKVESEGNVCSMVQETLNSLAADGASETDTNNISSVFQQTLDSVHELPPKLVKDILFGEFMELSKLLPKNFNLLQPLTLTLENSVIRVNKTKVTSITNIEEWNLDFTSDMGVIIRKHPTFAAELLEYLSLICYAACVFMTSSFNKGCC